jgi:DNA topoisomerase II
MPPKTQKTIEETYQKLSQREHILLRNGMYIGSVDKSLEELWAWDNGRGRMTKRMLEFSPAFLKIFDEVLTNATDHAARDPNVTMIKVDFDTETGEICVWNNGSGVPVVMHKDHNVYVPELIFGQLLSGSNYDDSQDRTGAGTNGIGIKCTNIFSKRFVVETIDSENGLKFVQEYKDNMSVVGKPKITKNSGKSYTKITFLPDYSRFKMSGLEKDTVALLSKRVYDCIACTEPHVGVFLNGQKLKGKGLVDYAKYFFGDSDSTPAFFNEMIVAKSGKTELVWEIIVTPSDKFDQVSFVNGNSTYAGGKHVDHIMYQITSRLKTLLETKKKLKDVKPMFIKERIFLFLRATVINPAFSSQTKEYLTTPPKDFRTKIELSDKFIDRLWKSPIIDDIVQYCKLKETLDLAKTTDGKKKNRVFIPKLEDALWAGTAKSNQCTLVLTEGDSAKTFAMWGRSVVGPERWAVFPLRGKFLNFRDATVQQLMNNEEINNLKQIIGLKQGKEYKDTSDLRYGKVMLLTDADADGSHIKGLLMNFIHAQWPSLLRLSTPFLQTLRTPIVKAVRGKQVVEFFTQQDYEAWRERTDNAKNYQIKYFKGLGTSTKEDAKSTFSRIDQLQVDYYYKNKGCDDAILLAFGKDRNVAAGGAGAETAVVKCSDKRKQWLGNYNRHNYIGADEKLVSYQDFINKELIHFSIYDNLRSIPSLCDGLKPSQRKIMYYMLSRKITKSMKVAQLSGYISAETSYHHGETSLQQAIIGMAQNFVGTNNINLLYPDGNHGSRMAASGKDAASPRYIFTRLERIAQAIFHPHDMALLNYLDDDGQKIEPEWYIPVIPMILVNGCEGIGTGYSTTVPPHNPVDIISNIRRIIKGEQPLAMQPYFKGFGGEVVELENGSWMTTGRWKRISDYQVQITELPVGTAITPYKEFLESLVVEGGGAKKSAGAGSAGAGGATKTKRQHTVVLKDVQNKTTDENTGINFLIEFKDMTVLDKLVKAGTLTKELKLSKTFSTNNMYLFDDNLAPLRYATTNDILLDFCDIRMEFYTKRRKYMIKQLTEELTFLKAKVRFISEYIDGTLDINRKRKADVIRLLESRDYPKHTVATRADDTDAADTDADGADGADGAYDYLIRMQLVSLTREKIDQLNAETERKEKELKTLKRKTDGDLWIEDLEAIESLL